jgi:ABC-2 type transport system ATP-binding protein
MAALHRTAYSEERVKQTSERLDLAARALDRPARTYSKGMMQKLGLAACLLSGKNLQILDEPTSGLDPKARALLKRELRSLRAEGRTVFFTSHSLSDVEQICDRMAVLDGGRLRFAGPPAELMTRYGGRDLEHAFLACIGGIAA